MPLSLYVILIMTATAVAKGARSLPPLTELAPE